MDSFEWTKIVGALCSTFLVFLLVQTGANAVIGPGPDKHHGGHGDDEHHNAYVIEVEDGGHGGGEAEEEETIDIAALMESADAANGEGLFKACQSCHKLEDGANAVGPHLFGLIGRDIGGVGGFAYSDALTGKGEVWTYENLQAFLADPKGWAPGTKMSYRGMRKPEDRADLIAFLEANG